MNILEKMKDQMVNNTKRVIIAFFHFLFRDY